MKKAIACLLALPLALAACGAQGADSAQSQPATETEHSSSGNNGNLSPFSSNIFLNTSSAIINTISPLSNDISIWQFSYFMLLYLFLTYFMKPFTIT